MPESLEIRSFRLLELEHRLDGLRQAAAVFFIEFEDKALELRVIHLSIGVVVDGVTRSEQRDTQEADAEGEDVRLVGVDLGWTPVFLCKGLR